MGNKCRSFIQCHAVFVLLAMIVFSLSGHAEMAENQPSGTVIKETEHYKLTKILKFNDAVADSNSQYLKFSNMIERHRANEKELRASRPWKHIMRELGRLKKNKAEAWEFLVYVNSTMNNWVDYQKDNVNYKVTDYYGSPFETLSRQVGDCDDFAVLKYFILKEIFKEDELYLLFVQVPGGGAHLIVAVASPYDMVLLDNKERSLQVMRESSYSFIYAINEKGTYSIGRKSMPKVALKN